MERSEHAAIKIEVTAPQSICARAASPAVERLVAIRRADSRDQAFAPLAGLNAEAFSGRLGSLHLDGADRLDSK